MAARIASVVGSMKYASDDTEEGAPVGTGFPDTVREKVPLAMTTHTDEGWDWLGPSLI